MSSVDTGAVHDLMRVLAGHRSWAYLVLFVGALVETMLPMALLVPGEVVFLAGAMLAGLKVLDLVTVSLVMVAGGIAGDHASYWIGRRHGEQAFARLRQLPWLGRRISERRLRRARAYMRRHGTWAVFMARFAGPASWFTPMLAGAGRLRYARFAGVNAPAAALGIGQFIVLGYLAGRQAGQAHRLTLEAWWLLPVVAFLAMLLVWILWRRHRRTSPTSHVTQAKLARPARKK